MPLKVVLQTKISIKMKSNDTGMRQVLAILKYENDGKKMAFTNDINFLGAA